MHLHFHAYKVGLPHKSTLSSVCEENKVSQVYRTPGLHFPQLRQMEKTAMYPLLPEPTSLYHSYDSIKTSFVHETKEEQEAFS